MIVCFKCLSKVVVIFFGEDKVWVFCVECGYIMDKLLKNRIVLFKVIDEFKVKV